MLKRLISGTEPAMSLKLTLVLAIAATLGAAPAAHAVSGPGPLTGLAGKCATVTGGATANGTRIQLRACAGSGAQSWTVQDDGTIRALGKCLDVQGGSAANGTPIQLWDCLGNTHQKWIYDSASGRLVNPATAGCLDVTGQSGADGTPLQLWTCNNQTNQQWTLPGQPPACRRAPGQSVVSVGFAGKRYPVTVHVPASAPAIAPLVLNLHGSGSSGAGQLSYSNMAASADANGYLAAFPEGAISYQGGLSWTVPGVGTPPAGARDDVGFLDQVVTTLTGALCADPHRIHLTGYSGGGRMASAFACARPERIAAIAPVAGLRAGRPAPGNTSVPDPASCRPGVPVPVIAFHGKQDATNPYDGGGTDLWQYSVPVAQQRWAAIDGCGTGPVSTQVSTHVTRTTYCDVQLYTVADGGHTWPGSPQAKPENGNTTHEIDANTLMWRFFAAHTR